MPNFAAYGVLTYGQIPDENDHSIPDPIWRIQQGPGYGLRYLVELHPYSEDVEQDVVWLPGPINSLPYCAINGKQYGGETVIRLSDHQFITEPEDDPESTYYMPLVDNPLQFDMSLIRGRDIGINTPTYGAIEIANGDGELDELAKMSFSGRRIVVKAGYEGFRYDDYSTVFDGLISTIEYDDRGIVMTISDKGLLLDREIMTPEYAGTGGIEGNDDLAGQMKPLSFGQCFNIEPVLVDALNLIYQAHAWSMEAVDAVYDAGVDLSFDADYPDIASAAPGAGEYATCLATGHIKLGSTPAGRITADVKGDNNGGYAGNTSDICIRMATKLYDGLSFVMDDIDTGGWADLATKLTGPSGLYIQERRTLRQLFDTLLNPCLAYWYFTRFGLLSADLIDTAGTPTDSLSADLIDTAGIEMIDAIPPSWRISVAYAPVWMVQREDELAGGTTDSQRMFVGNEYRMVTHEDRSLRTSHAKPIERVFYTNLAEKADAEALLARMVRVYALERRIFRAVAYQGLFRIAMGDIINVSYPRYGINGRMTVMGISEDAKNGQTTMELWG